MTELQHADGSIVAAGRPCGRGVARDWHEDVFATLPSPLAERILFAVFEAGGRSVAARAQLCGVCKCAIGLLDASTAWVPCNLRGSFPSLTWGARVELWPADRVLNCKSRRGISQSAQHSNILATARPIPASSRRPLWHNIAECAVPTPRREAWLPTRWPAQTASLPASWDLRPMCTRFGWCPCLTRLHA